MSLDLSAEPWACDPKTSTRRRSGASHGRSTHGGSVWGPREPGTGKMPAGSEPLSLAAPQNTWARAKLRSATATRTVSDARGRPAWPSAAFPSRKPPGGATLPSGQSRSLARAARRTASARAASARERGIQGGTTRALRGEGMGGVGRWGKGSGRWHSLSNMSVWWDGGGSRTGRRRGGHRRWRMRGPGRRRKGGKEGGPAISIPLLRLAVPVPRPSRCGRTVPPRPSRFGRTVPPRPPV